MRKYQSPEIEISNLNSGDIIATSTHIDKGYDSGLAPISPKPEEAVY